MGISYIIVLSLCAQPLVNILFSVCEVPLMGDAIRPRVHFLRNECFERGSEQSSWRYVNALLDMHLATRCLKALDFSLWNEILLVIHEDLEFSYFYLLFPLLLVLCLNSFILCPVSISACTRACYWFLVIGTTPRMGIFMRWAVFCLLFSFTPFKYFLMVVYTPSTSCFWSEIGFAVMFAEGDTFVLTTKMHCFPSSGYRYLDKRTPFSSVGRAQPECL